MPPANYNTNTTTAEFGNENPAVLAYQQNLNKQNAGKPGWIPLLEDSKYGPKTQAASNWKPQSSVIINTSTKSRTNFSQNSSALDAAMAKIGGQPTVSNPTVTTTKIGPDGQPTDSGTGSDILNNTSDPIVAGLNTMAANSDAATKALIASTQAAYQNKINTVNKQYGNYKAGLQQLGIEHNEAQATPDLLAGHIQQAANDQMEKINALTAEESKALIDAKTAKDNNDFKLLQAKMDYVKQVQTAKADAIKNMYDAISNADKAAAIEAHDIYDTMQTLSPNDQEAFIQAVASKYGLPVNNLVTALVDEKNKRDTANVDLANKKSILANRGGGGKGGKVTVQSASDEIDTNIQSKNLLGSDGYMAPENWISLRDQWVKNKLPAATFNTLYKRYLNPLSYEQAGFPKPKSGRTL